MILRVHYLDLDHESNHHDTRVAMGAAHGKRAICYPAPHATSRNASTTVEGIILEVTGDTLGRSRRLSLRNASSARRMGGGRCRGVWEMVGENRGESSHGT